MEPVENVKSFHMRGSMGQLDTWLMSYVPTFDFLFTAKWQMCHFSTNLIFLAPLMAKMMDGASRECQGLSNEGLHVSLGHLVDQLCAHL